MLAPSSDAPAQLMQLRQPEPFRILNDDAICIRNIHANFNNGCGRKRADCAGTEFTQNFELLVLANF